MRIHAICALSLLLATGVASAERVEVPMRPTFSNYSASVAYAFISACMQYAGDPSGLRMKLAKLAEAADDEAKPYLQGRAGKVFAKGSANGEQIFLSLDDGGCELIATKVIERDFRAELDKILQTLKVVRSSEHEDAAQGLKNVDYEIQEPSSDGVGWRLVLSLSFPLGGKRGLTLFSAYPLDNH